MKVLNTYSEQSMRIERLLGFSSKTDKPYVMYKLYCRRDDGSESCINFFPRTREEIRLAILCDELGTASEYYLENKDYCDKAINRT